MSKNGEKPVVISFGRSAAITQGHHNNFMFGKNLADSLDGEYHIHLSQSFDNKKNPLRHDDKVQLAKQMMPHLAHHFSSDKDIKTIFHAMKKYSGTPGTSKDAHVIVGADRKEEFENLLQKYNGSDYHYRKVHVHSSGDRVKGVSGTDMRNHAINGDFDSFAAGIPSTGTLDHAREMYEKIRQVMLAPEPEKPKRTSTRKTKTLKEFLEEGEIITSKRKRKHYQINPDIKEYQELTTHRTPPTE